MIGVTFGIKHSYDDFGLILSSKEIGLPEPKLEKVSVIGRNGDIDLTDALCDTVTYNNRLLSFTFSLPNAHVYWTRVLSDLSNYLHGKRMRVILDADKTFYYYGRCAINSFKTNKTLGIIVVDCDVEPYKIEVNSASDPWLWDPFSFVDGIIHQIEYTLSATTQTIDLINRAKVVSPTFTISAGGAVMITHNADIYSIIADANASKTVTIYDIRLQEGDNYITAVGTGTLRITYRGGSL